MLTRKTLLFEFLNYQIFHIIIIIGKLKKKVVLKEGYLQTINTGEGMENREPLCTVGENVNWCSHYG